MATTLSPDQVRPGRTRVTPPPNHIIILLYIIQLLAVARDLIARLPTCRGALGPNTVSGHRALRSSPDEIKYTIFFNTYKSIFNLVPIPILRQYLPSKVCRVSLVFFFWFWPWRRRRWRQRRHRTSPQQCRFRATHRRFSIIVLLMSL